MENEGSSSGDSELDYQELEEAVESSPFNVEAHIELIDFHRSNGDLKKIMEARKRAVKIIQLPERLWSEWIGDEIKFMENTQDISIITNLFYRALDAYNNASLPLWDGLITFLKDKVDRKQIQRTFEEALTNLGLDPILGPQLYEKYRIWETPTDNAPDQRERELKVLKLYLRQLNVPQPSADDLVKELEEKYGDKAAEVVNEAKKRVKTCNSAWKKRSEIEESLKMGGLPAIEASSQLIELEQKEGDASRIVMSLLRAANMVKSHSKRWLDLGRFHWKLKQPKQALSAIQRGVKEAPSQELWEECILMMEGNGKSLDELFATANIAHANNFDIFLIVADAARRAEKESKMNKAFQRALTDAQEENDKEIVLRHWIQVITHTTENVEEIQRLGEQLLKLRPNPSSWHLYLNSLRHVCIEKDQFSILQGAYQKAAQSFPDQLGSVYQSFLRQMGSLEDQIQARQEQGTLPPSGATSTHAGPSVGPSIPSVGPMIPIVGNEKENRKRSRSKSPSQPPRKARPGLCANVAARAMHKITEAVRANNPNAVHPPDAPAAPSGPPGIQITPGAASSTSSPRRNNSKSPNARNKIRSRSRERKRSQSQPKIVGDDTIENIEEESSDEEMGSPCSGKGDGKVIGKKNRKNVIRERIKEERKFERETLDIEKPAENPHYLAKKFGEKAGEINVEERTIYIGGLDWSVKEADLEDMFNTIPGFETVRIIRDFQGKSKGYGYADFKTAADVQKASAKYHETELHGCQITVLPSKPTKKLYDEKTAFCLNLPEDAKTFFDPLNVTDVRRAGSNKSYVDFASKEELLKALEKNGSVINELTVSVSRSIPMKDHRWQHARARKDVDLPSRAAQQRIMEAKDNTSAEASKNSKVLFVKNLAFSCSEGKLKAFFENAVGEGKIEQVIVSKDEKTGRKLGFGFIEMKEEQDAFTALSLDGMELEGRSLTVSRSHRALTQKRTPEEIAALQEKKREQKGKDNKGKGKIGDKGKGKGKDGKKGGKNVPRTRIAADLSASIMNVVGKEMEEKEESDSSDDEENEGKKEKKAPRPKVSKKSPAKKNEEIPAGGLSNDDFRKFLLG